MRFITAAIGSDSTRNHRKTIVGRKLTSCCRSGGSSAAIRPVMGATMSQNPMMKNPARTGPSSRLSTLSVPIGSSRLFSLIFQSYVFLAKSKRSAPIFRCFHRNMRDATDAPKPEREPDSGGTGTGREGRRRSVLRKIFGSGSCPYPDFSYLCIFDKNATRCFCSHT